MSKCDQETVRYYIKQIPQKTGVNKRPKYTRQYNDGHKKRRTEFRRKIDGKTITYPLREPVGSEAFWEDYNAALNGVVPPGIKQKLGTMPIFRGTTKPQSLRWLIETYKSSASFTRLAKSTRIVRAGILDELSIKYGEKPYADLTHEAVLKIRDKKADRPGAANAVVKAIRQVYKYALEYNIKGVLFDPTRDVRYLKSKNPDGFHAWSFDEVKQFEDKHPIGTKARLALALMLYAGCPRNSDTHRLGRQHQTKNGRLQYTQFKGRNTTPVHVDIEIIDELRSIIDASPCGDITFIVNQWGNPFTVKGFYNWFKKRCKEAGLPHCCPHGMRKAAARTDGRIRLVRF